MIRRLISFVRHDVWMSVTHGRRRLARNQIVHCLVRHGSDRDVQQRHVDVLPPACLFAIRQRGQRADHGVKTGKNI